MNKKKSRTAKKLYLIREIQELWNRTVTAGSLRVNKIRAHCLECHDADYTFDQVRQAMWAFHGQASRSNGGVNIFSSVPDIQGGKFVGLIKIGDDAESRAILEEYRKTTLSKDGRRLMTHKEYLDTDVRKKLFTAKIAERIILAAGLSPWIKELPAHVPSA